MKTIITCLSFLLFLITNLQAQNSNGTVRGSVSDEENKKIDGASITLMRAKDSAVVKIAVSDRSGNYEFENIRSGDYVVSVTQIGFAGSRSEVFTLSETNPSFIVPSISLKRAEQALGQVTVVAKRPLIENKMDKTVVNVEAAPTNAGSSALEILEKSPGVTVSNEGVISLKGKQGVIVMMDGKQTYLSPADLANLLRNLPASALDQIEIMSNPSSKFDAAGNSGIINIKTKKNNNEGLNGSLTQGSTVGWYERNGDDTHTYRNTTSLNLNYRKSKINLFGSYNYNYREGRAFLDITRKFFEKNGDLNSISNSTTDFVFRNNNHTLKVGMDYYADKKNIFGFVLNGFGFFGRPRPFSTQTISNPDGSVQSVLQTKIQNEFTFSNYSANFNYKHIFDSTGREFTTDFDYVGYTNAFKNDLATDVFDANGNITGNLLLKGDIPGQINIFTLKSDYTHPIDKSSKFEAGFKLSQVKNDNEVDYQRWADNKWIRDSRSNHFIYEENINAAYASINRQWKKFSAQLGIRVENTIAKGYQVTTDSTFKRNYTNVFPTGYVNYEATKSHTFTISLGRRIERPNYQDLNPFIFFLDSLSFRRGNPYLLPQFSYNVEFRHAFKSILTTSVNYTITDDVISELLQQNTEAKITFLTVDNVARFRNVGVTITATVKPAKWWNMNTTANLFNNRYTGVYFNSLSGRNDPIDLEYTSYVLNVTNSFTFPKGWSAEISGFYRAKNVDELTIVNPMYFMNVGGQKNVLKGKGTLRFNIRDPFHWQVYSGRTAYSDIDVTLYNKWDNRNATVTFTYRFGKSSVEQARRRNSGANEEQNRVGGGGQG
jgi:iron complex outermembrane receptor protein